MLRDRATRSKSISLAPSDLLWSAISNGKQSHLGASSRVLHDLIYAVQLFLPHLPFRRVVELLTKIREMFSALDANELQQYDQIGIDAASAAAAAAVSATSETGQPMATKNTAGQSSSGGASDPKVPEASVKDFVESMKQDTSSLLLILEKFKTEFLFNGIAGVPNSEAVTLSLNSMKEKFVNDVSSVATKKIDIRSSSSSNCSKKFGATSDLVTVNCIDMFEGILADVTTWLESVVRGVRRLSPVRPVEGVFHLTEQCIASLQECTDDNLQTT